MAESEREEPRVVLVDQACDVFTNFGCLLRRTGNAPTIVAAVAARADVVVSVVYLQP